MRGPIFTGFRWIWKPFGNPNFMTHLRPRKWHCDYDYPWQDINSLRWINMGKRVHDAYRRRSFFHTPWILPTNILTNETLAILVPSGIAAGLIYVFMLMPPADFPLRTLVVVPEGATSSEIGGALKEQRVIRSGLVFRGLSIVLGYERDLHAGDYMFDEPVSVFHIVRKLALGAYGLEPIHIRIPEGAMTRNMATIFAKQLVRFNAENFLAQAKPMEGYLFPDTYYFMPNATEDTILRTMRQNFDSHIAPLLPEIEASGHTLEDIMVMASMLEREARKSEDRRKIAGVLWNP